VEKIRITNAIRKLRFERDEMTQQALAEAVGVTRQTIAAIEKAKYAPSLELAILIARALSKPLGDVFMVEGEDQSIDLPCRPGGEPDR